MSNIRLTSSDPDCDYCCFDLVEDVKNTDGSVYLAFAEEMDEEKYYPGDSVHFFGHYTKYRGTDANNYHVLEIQLQ